MNGSFVVMVCRYVTLRSLDIFCVTKFDMFSLRSNSI